MTFQTAYKKLNKQQKLAVDSIEGPVMVVAGPGTGKTQVLALRIVNILEKIPDILPNNILCLTFTEAGAKAMRERLKSFIGSDAYSVAIHTFHSFTNEIIQTFPEKFEFSRDPQQLDDLGRIKLMQEIIDEPCLPAGRLEKELKNLRPFHNHYARVKDIIRDIQNLKKEGIDAEKLKEKNDELKKQHEANPELVTRGKNKGQPKAEWKRKLEKFENTSELAMIYELYEKRIKEAGFYDYEDMIMFVIEAFERDDELLAYFQEKYLYIHVDEYQDTNGAQNEIIKLLGSFDSSPNIFVVGDDDQAIYRFQGANLNNIMFFSKHFEGVERISISDNYRSTQDVLDAADSLIDKNQNRLVNQFDDIDKKLSAAGRNVINHVPTTKARLFNLQNGDEENIFIAKEIQKLTQSGIEAEDIAVLYRQNIHGEDIAETLSKFDVPIKLDTPKTIFTSTLVQQLIDLLRVIRLYDKNEDLNLYRVLMYDFWDLDVVDVYRLVNLAKEKRVELLELVMDDVGASTARPPEGIDIEKIQRITNLIFRWHKLDSNIAFPKLIEIILEESGILDFALRTPPRLRQGSGEQAQPPPKSLPVGRQGEGSANSVDSESSPSSLREAGFFKKDSLGVKENNTSVGLRHALGLQENSFDDVLALNRFFEYIKIQARVNKDLDISSFLRDLELIESENIRINLPKVDSKRKGVNLLTAHSSKGLEFNTVFITKATASNWGRVRADRSIVPKELMNQITAEELDLKIKADPKDSAIEDERRLFFVAITRAKENLYFTYANEYSDESTSKPSQESVSPFVEEIDTSLILKFDKDSEGGEVVDYQIEDYINILRPTKKISYSKQEKEYLLERIKDFKLSASALNSFLRDPNEFKEKYLIRIPEATNKHMALGSAIHAALERWNRSLIGSRRDLPTGQAGVGVAPTEMAENSSRSGESAFSATEASRRIGLSTGKAGASSPTTMVSLDELNEVFQKRLYRDFFGDDEYEDTMKQGKLILEKYYKFYTSEEEFSVPTEVEYNFGGHEVLLDESEDDPIPLTGRIDKVELINPASNEVRVVDYKVAKYKSENHIKGKTKGSDGSIWRQLVFYKLLGDLDSNFRPAKKFNQPKYSVKEVQVDFVDAPKNQNPKKIALEVTNQDVEELKKIIFEVMGKIRRLEF